MSQLTLLVVDDDHMVRVAYGRALGGSYRVLLAADASEALSILERTHVDIILTDHYMPGMSGMDLLARVASLWPQTLRILFSGAPDVAMAIRAVNLGDVFRILVKPIELEELRFVLDYAVEALRLERENLVYRALVEGHPELHAQFQASMAKCWPALAGRGLAVPPQPAGRS